MKRHFSPAMAELAVDDGSATIKRMWLPRFTLRWAFMIVTVCAFLALIAGQAVAGKEWAIAVFIAMGGGVFFFVVYGLFYVILRALPVASPSARLRATTNSTSDARAGESPGTPR